MLELDVLGVYQRSAEEILAELTGAVLVEATVGVAELEPEPEPAP